jgi:hypothetical protein
MLGSLIVLLGILGFYIYKMYEPYFETMKHVKHRSGVTRVLLSLNLNSELKEVV